MTHPAPLLQAEGLAHAYPGVPVLAGLSFTIRPGLTLVRGGDGRGKTTLLRLMAGTLRADAGVVRRAAAEVYFEHPADAAHDGTVARAWLDSLRPRFAGWADATAQALTEALGLGEHIDKPLYMLSTGSRRKVGLVGAAASGAALTLLDTPFAALDAPSSRVLVHVLGEAASSEARAWVVADHALPAALAGARLAGLIELGD